MAAPVDLNRRPEAKTESVEDLVAAALRGEVRIPIFQRGLAWTSENVLELFDSIYRGYPIGSLLLRRGPGKAGPFQLGPLQLNGEETSHAQWVVDGQQRLTSLAAGLGRPGPVPTRPDDPFAVYFDAQALAFRAPPSDGEVPTQWVPLPRLLNGSELSEWVFSWTHGQDAAMRATVFDAGRRLREYKLPVYVIDTEDEEVLRTIFHRVNNSGKALTWAQVHDALFGHKSAEPSSLGELADALEALGMGRLEEDKLLPCLVALRGLDVTRSFGEHLRNDPAVLEGVAAEAAPVLREVLGFLRTRAEIPHLRLLPISTPLPVLARFFQLHPEPNPRSHTLLVRWLWRIFFVANLDDRALRRRGVAAISDDDEEGSVQRLLALLDGAAPAPFEVTSFDARSAHSRLAMLCLTSLQPRQLTTDLPGGEFPAVDVAGLLRDADRDAFRAIFPSKGESAQRSEANRLLLAGVGFAASQLQAFIAQHGTDHPVLASHAISPACAAALASGQFDQAIAARATELAALASGFGDRLASWERGDRPSIEYLLAQVAP